MTARHQYSSTLQDGRTFLQGRSAGVQAGLSPRQAQMSLRNTLIIRHSERSEESLFDYNAEKTERFFTSQTPFRMTVLFFSQSTGVWCRLALGAIGEAEE
jgi:hypothetical protein